MLADLAEGNAVVDAIATGELAADGEHAPGWWKMVLCADEAPEDPSATPVEFVHAEPVH